MNEEEEVHECADCGAIVEISDQNHENADGERVCEECAEQYTTCEDCGEIVSRDSEYRDEGGRPICESCSDHYNSCGDCGDNVDRYCALNYSCHTVEVRIFNSTIRTDRFFKNLETVKAAIDFSKQSSLRAMDAHNFLGFVMQNRGRYRNLATFLVEKCVHSLDDVAVDVRVVQQVQKRIMRRAG